MTAPARLWPALALTCLFVPASLAAQAAATSSPAAQTAPDLALYAAEPGVILNRTSLIHMNADGTGTREYEIALRVQSDALARQLSVVSISYSSATEKAEYLYARVRHPDGTVTDSPVSGAIDQPEQVTREAPFYSDLKSLQLPVRNLGTGDTLEWKARFTELKPEIPGQFWGQESLIGDGIVLHEAVELRVPVSRSLLIWTNPTLAAPSDTHDGAERVVRWTGSHLQPSVGAEAEARKHHLLTPDEQLAARKGALPSLAWTTFDDWTAVGTWYQGLTADRLTSSPELAAKVAQLTAGKTTEEDKAFALYQYVATQVRYVGVAFGVGRYRPHTAAEILANGYGDCKDKHILLAAMLQTIGLHPDAVLIGAGLRFNNDVPSPASFNHLITTVPVHGKQVWLDTTAEVAPWNTLLPQLRDQEVLVVPASDTPHIERTEAAPPFPAYTKLVAAESLDSSLTSDARVTLTFHDDDELALRTVLHQVSPAQYGEFVQRFVASLGFGGTTSESEISPVNDLNTPLTLSYRYKRTKEEDWGVNRVTEPFWPSTLPVIDEKEPPVAPLELGALRTETSFVRMQLPKGWSAELPEAVHAKSSYATVDTTFQLKGEEVIAERKLTILTQRVPAASWRDYQRWYKDSGVNTYPYVQLVPAKGNPAPTPVLNTPETGSTAPSSPSPSSPATLISDAGSALQNSKPDQARHLLDQAKDIDPKAKGLWWGYAAVSYQMGEMHRAEEEVTKELAAYPDEARAYALLAGAQQQQHNHAAALVSMQKWHAGDPDSPDAAIGLMQFYAVDKRPLDGIVVGTETLHRLESGPVNVTALRIQLASLDASAGKHADAAEVVRPLEGKVQDPGQRNSVAYFLADARIDLSADETTEREVLAKLDDETSSWTLDESPGVLFGKTSLMVACWDTMGWILFQQNHLPEAGSYLEAAWRNHPDSDGTAHVEALHSALHSTSRDTRSEQQRRTFPLEAAHGRHGTREVKLLLGQGKVLRAVPASSASGSSLSDQEVTDLAAKADLRTLFPQGSTARLMRGGVVNCSGTACELVLFPMNP